jgi:hypothetical protein
MVPNEQQDGLFEAVVQATEEAIINALVAAQTMIGKDGVKVLALPHDRLRAVLKKYNRRMALPQFSVVDCRDILFKIANVFFVCASKACNSVSVTIPRLSTTETSGEINVAPMNFASIAGTSSLWPAASAVIRMTFPLSVVLSNTVTLGSLSDLFQV